MSDDGLGQALWLSVLGGIVAIAGLAPLVLAILIVADPESRPDSLLDWSVYTYLGLPAALGLCVGGFVWSARLYRRAVACFSRHLWEHKPYRG